MPTLKPFLVRGSAVIQRTDLEGEFLRRPTRRVLETIAPTAIRLAALGPNGNHNGLPPRFLVQQLLEPQAEYGLLALDAQEREQGLQHFRALLGRTFPGVLWLSSAATEVLRVLTCPRLSAEGFGKEVDGPSVCLAHCDTQGKPNILGTGVSDESNATVGVEYTCAVSQNDLVHDVIITRAGCNVYIYDYHDPATQAWRAALPGTVTVEMLP